MLYEIFYQLFPVTATGGIIYQIFGYN